MAQVDFSNAVLQPYSNSYYPMTRSGYLALGSNGALLNEYGYAISSTVSKTFLTNTPSKVSILCVGNFTTSGTEFYMGTDLIWKISNVSFSNGDTFSFVIDIETSGNT